MQKGIFVMLVIIAFLLGCNIYQGNESHAAKKYMYTHRIWDNNPSETISKMSSEGWEFVQSDGTYKLLFFKK